MYTYIYTCVYSCSSWVSRCSGRKGVKVSRCSGRYVARRRNLEGFVEHAPPLNLVASQETPQTGGFPRKLIGICKVHKNTNWDLPFFVLVVVVVLLWFVLFCLCVVRCVLVCSLRVFVRALVFVLQQNTAIQSNSKPNLNKERKQLNNTRTQH